MENIHDWCISRQLWWGHQLPVWYCEDCGKSTVAEDRPPACSACDKTELRQEEDVLDTWFSSSLWPFTTLGWPEKTEKLEKFYPTSVLCTAWDILFFWVARMIMMGLKFTGKVPFHKVYLHPLISDEKGKKMSKSKGNAIDPLIIMENYGTDAFRFALVSPQADSPYLPFSEDRVRGYRNFANKIWNASRFVLMNLEDFAPQGEKPNSESIRLSDKWILNLYSSLIKKVTLNLENFEFSQAAHRLYQFFWGEFCDWYIELVKFRLLDKEDSSSRYTAQWMLWYILKGTLKLLHPFIPFITEEIYQRLSGAEESIMVSCWPLPSKEISPDGNKEMHLLREIIQEVRTIRSEIGILPQIKIELWLRTGQQVTPSPFPLPCGERIEVRGKRKFLYNQDSLNTLKENEKEITNLTKTRKLVIGKALTKPAYSASSLIEDVEIFIPLAELIDMDKEKKRLKANWQKLEKEILILEKRLSNPHFLEKAPPEIVQKEKEREKALTQKSKRLKKRLKEIK
jgi:valyl-tRNA synthetase